MPKKETIETMYWNINKDSIEDKSGELGVYWEYYLEDIEMKLKVNGDKIVGKTKEAYMEIKRKL